jgi:hypothetical protein
MASLVFNLEHHDGTPADPPTLNTAVPNWRRRHIPLGRDRTLHVVELRPGSESRA